MSRHKVEVLQWGTTTKKALSLVTTHLAFKGCSIQRLASREILTVRQVNVGGVHAARPGPNSMLSTPLWLSFALAMKLVCNSAVINLFWNKSHWTQNLFLNSYSIFSAFPYKLENSFDLASYPQTWEREREREKYWPLWKSSQMCSLGALFSMFCI